MGIRFLCGHCQRRLNVKSTLAGEYCFCPDCGEEILIPLVSTIERLTKRPKRKGKGVSESQGEEFKSSDSSSGTATLERPSRISGVSEFYPRATQSPEADSDRIVAEATASLRAAEAETQRRAEEARLIAEAEAKAERIAAEEEARLDAEMLAEDEVASPAQAVEENDALLATRPVERSDPEGEDAPQEPSTEQATVGSFQLSKPAAKIEDDPLTSNPKLIWYLRDRTLGEKGPLKAQQVEAMLETGQVRPGSILWREDWNEWLPAEQVFPQLVKKATKSNYQIPDELNPHSEANKKQRAKKRFWMAFNIAAFLLIIVLVYWLAQVISN